MHNTIKQYIDQIWDESIIPTLNEYIKIPNKSPQFDPEWREHGYMNDAVNLITDWCEKNALPTMSLEVVQIDARTPVILIEVKGQSDDTVLLYGHLDKQPEMTGWDNDLGPWKPVIKGDRLYGRGGADDGYAVFASLTALKALHEAKIPHARCVILIEACEESGSYDLPFYIDALEDRIGKPSLVICLDSGCGNYNQLWTTTSLRGLVTAIVTIEVLKEGVHSGSGSGVVPSCFQILRQLLSRIEDEQTGNVLLDDLYVDIPSERVQQAEQAAAVLQKNIFSDLPFQTDVLPRTGSLTDLVLNRTWRPALSIIGLDGIPAIQNAGNVTLPTLTVKLSMRLAPTCDPDLAAQAISSAILREPPYNAKISCHIPESAGGWNAPKEAGWLRRAANDASRQYFGAESVAIGEGGSIPFMGMLGKKFPEAQFLITGLLGPQSNAHGPNEFLHIPTAKNLTACVADVIAAHFKR